MPADEFEAWREFYRLYPFDDEHRFLRPAAVVAAAGRQNPNAAFQAWMKFLQPDPPTPEELSGYFSEADLRTISALGGSLPEVK